MAADPPRADPPRADPPRADPPRADPPRADPPRGDASTGPAEAAGPRERPLPLPLLGDGGLETVVKVLTDYPRDDLASDEVHQALVAALVRHRVRPVNVDVGAITGLDTVSAAFKTAQLALNSPLGLGHLIYTNCAPRKHIVSTRSKGEKMVLGMLASGVVLLLVNSGYTLSPFKALAAAGRVHLFESRIPDEGSQFRSRDFFPEATAQTARHLIDTVARLGPAKVRACLSAGAGPSLLEGLALLGEPLDLSTVAEFPRGSVWYVDNFGNIKLNLEYDWLIQHFGLGTPLVVALGQVVARPQLTGAGFSQGEGVLALTAGSSGWDVPDASGHGHHTLRFAELFLRGGRAADQLGGVRPGDTVIGLALAELDQALDRLRAAEPALLHRIGLQNVSEAQLIDVLVQAGLIHDGFDTSRLRAVLAADQLISHLAAFEAFRLGHLHPPRRSG